MKTPLLFLFAVLTFGLVASRSLAGTAAGDIAGATAADNARVAATLAQDRAGLEAVLSDELHYCHSNGHVDTKASLLESVALRRTIHERYEYLERNFTSAAPGVVLMHGHVLFHVRTGELRQVLDLKFLAVWRNEGGHWRFLARQSCKIPPAAGK